MWQIVATICMIAHPDEACIHEVYGRPYYLRSQCEAARQMLVAPEHWYQDGYPEHVEGSRMRLKCEAR